MNRIEREEERINTTVVNYTPPSYSSLEKTLAEERALLDFKSWNEERISLEMIFKFRRVATEIAKSVEYRIKKRLKTT